MIKFTRLLVCLLCLSIGLQAQTYEFSQSYSFGSGPRGITHHDGKLYVALNGAGKIIIASTDGVIEKEIKVSAKPIDVAVDAQGRLLVASRDGKSVTLLSPAGEVIKTVTFAETVNGVTVRRNGHIYVPVVLGSTSFVYVLDENLEEVSAIRTLSNDKFREARKVFFDAADQLYLVDKNTGVYKIGSVSGTHAQVDYLIKRGNETAPGSTTFNRLAYMTITSSGDLVVTADETYNNSLLGVYRFNQNGSFTDVIGTLGTSSEESGFQAPYGIACDDQDHLYISDYKTGCVQKWLARDLTAPVISDLRTQSEVRGSVRLSFGINEQATFHYLVSSASAAAPTRDQLMAAGRLAISDPSQPVSLDIPVKESTPQVVWYLAVDSSGNESQIIATAPFTAETALKLVNLFVKAKTAAAAEIEFETNDKGTLYWLISDSQSAIPTPESLMQNDAAVRQNAAAGKKQLFQVELTQGGRYRLSAMMTSGDETSAVSSVLVSPSGDAETIYQRYLSLLKGDAPDYTDPLILARYEAIRSNVAKARQKLPSYQWQEGLEPIDLEKGREGRDIVSTVLMPLALNYHLSGPAGNPNPDFQNAAALKELTDLYDYMEKRGMVSGCAISFASSGSFLGMCGYYYAGLLMREELMRSGRWQTVEGLMAWMSRQVNPTDPEWGAEVENNGSRSDGVRTLYQNRLMALCAQTDDCVSRDEDLAYLQKALNRNMQISPAWDGFIKPDFTGYHHHGPWGNAYNTDALHTSCQMAFALRDTKYALNEESVDNLAQSLLTFRAYCAKYDISRGMCGRFPNQLNGMAVNVPAFAYLYPVLTGEMQQRIGGAFCRLFTPEYSGVMQNTVRDVTSDIFFHGGMGMLQQMIRISATGLSDYEVEEMNRVFPYSAMQVHRRGEWMAVVKSYTKYVWDFETNEEQNWLGRNQSAGALSLYATPDSEGVITAEASGVGYNGWDWSHVPGTTSLDMPIDSIIKEATLYTMAKFSPSAIAGGVSLEGKQGVYGMIFNDIRQAYTYNGKKWGTTWRGVTLSANKSWFFFDDEIVALASDISNTHPDYDAHTTLFQNVMPDTQTPLYVNGQAHTGLGTALDLTDGTPVVLTDIVGNAYLIPDAAGLHVHRAQQQSVQDRNYNNATQGNYATAWFDHKRATSGSYHYLIRVQGAADAAKLSTVPQLPYQIERQDQYAHVVNYPSKSLRGYAVFRQAQFGEDPYLVSADKACMIMMKQQANGSLTLSLSNPELGFYPENKFPYQVWSIDKDKLYAPSVEQPVTIVLKGNWNVGTASSRVMAVAYDVARDETTLRFNEKDAATVEVTLTAQTVGMEATVSPVISYGPNPFDESLVIYTGRESAHNVVLADMTGRTVYNRQHTGIRLQVDTFGLRPGGYLLSVDGVVAGKVMKK